MLDENDHRQMGKRLDLFHFQEEAPGMAFWHPRGLSLYRQLERAVTRQLELHDYQEVRTPQVLRRAIWEQSGHWQSFPEGMFVLEAEQAALKPVSCPGHVEIFRRMAPSFRDLPVRLAELGVVHRNEPSGTLQGLFRLRQFTQDDGHVFCAPEQIQDEVVRFCGGLLAFYAAFGFHDVAVALSLRPDKRAGSDDVWDRAEALLGASAVSAGIDYSEQPGAGAFYGPKLEFSLLDRFGRAWQCGTIQLDFVLPESFDIHYVDSGGSRRRPAMLHRALYGSVERFLGVVLEQHGGSLPEWLAPEQVVVTAISGAQLGYAREVIEALPRASVRARLDVGHDSLARRVARAHEAAVPFFVVVGAREARERSLSVRQSNREQVLSLEAGLDLIREACRFPF